MTTMDDIYSEYRMGHFGKPFEGGQIFQAHHKYATLVKPEMKNKKLQTPFDFTYESKRENRPTIDQECQTTKISSEITNKNKSMESSLNDYQQKNYLLTMQQAEDSEKWRLEKQQLESQQSAMNFEL